MTQTPSSAALFRAAQRLDESPTAILNGGASDALEALAAAAAETDAVAEARGIDVSVMNEVWSRADSRLREVPQGEEAVYVAAAEAASLLYVAAWAIEADSATTEQLQDLL